LQVGIYDSTTNSYYYSADVTATTRGSSSSQDDFNGNGISDMLWRNSSGTLAEWLMNGSTISTSSPPTYQGTAVTADSSWNVAAIADFDGAVSPDADVLWRNSNGALAIWLMNGETISSSAAPTYQGAAVSPNSTWNVVGTGDFIGNGNADILWRQSSTGALAMWQMNGSDIVSSAGPTYQGAAVSPNSTWNVVGTGDFNGDGKDDILWQQSSTGALAMWLMNGSDIASSAAPTYQGAAVSPNSSWTVAGIGDFYGNGNDDILWRQSSTGALAMWQMNGSDIVSSAGPTYQGAAVSPNSTWSILEVGDFNGSKDAGIIWQQSTTGALVEWQMDGSQIVSSEAITSNGLPVTASPGMTSQARPTSA
jgi:hypothetical protein